MQKMAEISISRAFLFFYLIFIFYSLPALAWPRKFEYLDNGRYGTAKKDCKLDGSTFVMLKDTRNYYFECRRGPAMKWADKAEEVYGEYKMEVDMVEDAQNFCYRLEKFDTDRKNCSGDRRPFKEKYLCCIDRASSEDKQFTFEDKYGKLSVMPGRSSSPSTAPLALVTLVAIGLFAQFI